VLYLGHTVERTRTPFHVPEMWGKSTLGRLGLFVHATAGFGDLGFDGQWTVELSCVHHVRVYPGQKIGQIAFHSVLGEIEDLYDGRYQGSTGAVAARPEKEAGESLNVGIKED
jgi:dCTP deaminase